MKAGEAVVPVTSKEGSQKADLVCGKSAILLWYLPAFALIIGLNWAAARAWLWIPAFLVMGATCVVNAARCGRLHCFVTGPVYLLALGSDLCGAGCVRFGAAASKHLPADRARNHHLCVCR